MTMTSKNDLDNAKVNQRVKYLGQIYRSTVISFNYSVDTPTNTHNEPIQNKIFSVR